MKFKAGIAGIEEFKKILKKRGYRFWIEPGRLVAVRRLGRKGFRRLHLHVELHSGEEIYPNAECNIHLDADGSFPEGTTTKDGRHKFTEGGKLVKREIGQIRKELQAISREQRSLGRKEADSRRLRKRGSGVFSIQSKIAELESKGWLTTFEKRKLEKYKSRLKRSK